LKCPPRDIAYPPASSGTGALAQALERQASTPRPVERETSQSWTDRRRYVMALLAPGPVAGEPRSLGDDTRQRLVEHLRGELDIPYGHLSALAYGDSAEGDEQVRSGTHLIQMIKGYGGYLGCSAIRFSRPPALLSNALESALLASLPPGAVAPMGKAFVEDFAVGRGIEVLFSTTKGLIAQETIELFRKTELWAGLAQAFETAVGAAPECLLLEEPAYEKLTLEEYRGAGTWALTELLKDRGCRMTAAKANRILVAKGVLEERERPSSGSAGGVKKFKALTELGLRYGVNVVNPNAPGETSPKYFPALFGELLEKYLNES
jgi:hypothetical protein